MLCVVTSLYGFSLSRGGGLSHARYCSNMDLGMDSLQTTCWSKLWLDLKAFLS